MPYASSHVLWRAAITLELLYGLISDNFENLFPLFESRNGSRPSDTLLSVLIEAVTDFAVVVSSNKVGIGSVVEASSIKGDDGEFFEENDGTDDESKIRLRNYSFDIKKIQPIITSRARDIVKVRYCRIFKKEGRAVIHRSSIYYLLIKYLLLTISLVPR
jgi:hypothetical protein